MKKFSNIIMLFFLAMIVSSCGEVKEEIWLDNDENINIYVDWDMTKASSEGDVGLGSLLGMLGKMVPTSANQAMVKNIMEQLHIKYDGRNSIDSTLFFKDIPYLRYSSLMQIMQQKETKNILNSSEREELAQAVERFSKNGYIQCQINLEKNLYKMKIRTGNFSLTDFKTMSYAFKKLNTAYELNADNVFAGTDWGIFFDISKRKFKRGKCDYARAINMGAGSRYADDQKLQMIFGDNKNYDFISIIHLPGKIRKFSNNLSKIGLDEKSVITKIQPSKMSAGATVENEISFR